MRWRPDLLEDDGIFNIYTVCYVMILNISFTRNVAERIAYLIREYGVVWFVQ